MTFTAAVSSAQGDEKLDPENCYDALVLARPVRQVPSVMPQFDDGSVIMRWPWFVDLKVERVLRGAFKKRKITVLSMQHTYYVDQAFMWWLRRNSAGGFNANIAEGGAKPVRCTAPPVPAYLTARDGKSLDDLRKDGERKYGKQPPSGD